MTVPRIDSDALASALVLLMLLAFFTVGAWSPHSERMDDQAAHNLPALPSVPASAVETGTHWATTSDFPTLQSLGYQFVITTVHPKEVHEWAEMFDAAEKARLKLIVGLWPPPYRLRQGTWTINPEGQTFLGYAASHANVVQAIFVYNEPYWLNPFTGKNDYCGALSAAELRDLRRTIRKAWPEAKIFHDLGRPSTWAPGGPMPRHYLCVGDKYADAEGVADLVGIWYYPFDIGSYRKSYALEELSREVGYVRNKMHAEPIIAGQAFKCTRCGEATRWPTKEELKDWNCALRSLGPWGISWYPWRQSSYDDYLSNHREMWSATEPGVCQ
jgi:hypothetical protein